MKAHLEEKSWKLYGHKKFNVHYLIVRREEEKKAKYRLKMYYYPIKPNDSKPNPNPIFIMSASDPQNKCLYVCW